MSRNPSLLIPADYSPVPSERTSVDVSAVATLDPSALDAVAVLVPSEGDLPGDLGTDLDRAALQAAGFDASAGSSLVVPRADGPVLVLVGAGAPGSLDEAGLRDAVAAAARATARTGGRLGVRVPSTTLSAADAGQVATEGALLARYRFTALRTTHPEKPLTHLVLALDGADPDEVAAGVATGVVTSRAAAVARDLANGPPGHLTASAMADVAAELGARYGFEVESFDKAQLIELGCGGILGVNAGSTEEPRMVKLRYVPSGEPDRAPRAGRQGDHVRLRRHQHQALRPDAPADEDGHGRRRRGARRVRGAARPGHDQRGHRLADVHRQHALRLGLQAR